MELNINVIVAYSDDFIIGNNNTIPWFYKEDLKYFQNITTKTNDILKKNIVIMGYNTYASLNLKKLKNRINIVITSKKLNNEIDLYFVDSLGGGMEECKRMLLNNEIEKIFIIGGASIYEYFFKSYYYKFLDKIYITRIDKTFEGNKFFYGLEEKFYYLSVEKSVIYPEIEYRVLQYKPDYNNLEKKYLDNLKHMLKYNNSIYDKELQKNVVSTPSKEVRLEINLQEYFPLFSFMKERKEAILNMLMSMFENNELKKNIYKSEIDLLNVKPFHSTYTLHVENNNLYCSVEHTKGNILTEIIYNIMFTSLMVIFISKIMNYKPYIIKYRCKNSYFLEDNYDIIERNAWNVPDVLPLLKLVDKDYKEINDFTVDDLYFLGLNI